MIFTHLEELKQYLKTDSSKWDINPVRFISVDSLDMWIEVKKILLSISDETVPFSKFCEDRDTMPNIRRISAAMKKAKHSMFITPLSEYLRINPDIASKIIHQIIKGNYPNNEDKNSRIRFYFLMYRIKSVLRTIPTDDPRTKNCINYLETADEIDYKLTIIQKDLDVVLPGNSIDGVKSYFEYWEANPDEPLILHTNNAIHLEKKHFFDDVRVIVSSFDLIRDQYRLPIELTEKLGSAALWNKLAKEIITEGDFTQACCSILSINKFSISLFERWNTYDTFKKWVLWIWSRLQASGSYVTICARASNTLSDFINALYCKICEHVDYVNYSEYYSDRKRILEFIHEVPTEEFWSSISKLERRKALACLTVLTDVERKAIFDTIAKIDFNDRGSILPIIKTVYSKLYYYLDNDEQLNSANLTSDHEAYFKEYKWLKATDTITASFMKKVDAFAKDKGVSVFVLSPRNTLVSNSYDDSSIILFVDGMGIEYVDYLAHSFSELDENKFRCTYEVGYCNLPSVTELNKDFMDKRRIAEPIIRDLDELKHSNNVHPESLIKQLIILDSIKDRVQSLFFCGVRKVIIAADHGTSRLAVKVRGTSFDKTLPKPEGVKIYKYGRFCEELGDESQYLAAININGKFVFADYSRFIQNGAPIDEIHGGASLEEWLVPVIVIEKIEKENSVIKIIPDKTTYRPEAKTRLIFVKFAISGPERTNVYVNIQRQKIKCEYKHGAYSFEYKTQGTAKITVKVFDGGIIGQFDLNIEQPIKRNEKFDI